MLKTTYYWLTSCENVQILKPLNRNALSSKQYSLPMSSTSFAVFLSALPHCRIFSKSTATREWLTCILDILQFRKTFFTKKKKRCWNRETKVLNGHTKRQCWQREKLPVKALHSAICCQKNFPREYFLAADRGDVYMFIQYWRVINDLQNFEKSSPIDEMKCECEPFEIASSKIPRKSSHFGMLSKVKLKYTLNINSPLKCLHQYNQQGPGKQAK